MKPTDALLKRLRKMVNDMKSGDQDDDVAFADEELKDMFEDAENIYQVAAEVWTIKASMLQTDIKSYSAGNEKYELTSLKDMLDHAMKMISLYDKKSGPDEIERDSSVMLKFKPPDVM